IALGRRRQLTLAFLERRLAEPTGIVVGGEHARPAVAALLDPERLAAQRLRHLLGVVPRFRPPRLDLHAAPHVRRPPTESRMPSGAGVREGLTPLAARSMSRMTPGRATCT